MADDTNNLTQGLSGMMNLADPSLLISVGLGLMSGARYGSNAGEGIMQGLQMYQGMKTNQLQQQLMKQQIQTGALGLQRQQMLTNAAQQAFQGDQGGQPPQAAGPVQSPPQASQPFLPGISPMPSGAPPTGVSAPSAAAPQGGALGLTAPSMAQIYGTTYPGGMPANFVRGMSYLSADPLGAQQKFRDDQLKLAQQSYAPTIAKLDQLIKSDAPAKYLNGTGFSDIKAAWPQLAQEVGLDPEKDYNDQNVRMALSNRRNQLASSLQEPTSEPAMPVRTIKLPDGRMAQVEPGTGKITPIASEELQSVIGPNGQPSLVPRSQAAGMTPFNPSIFGAAGMSDQALQFAADTYRTTGKMPPAFARNPMAQAKVLDRVAADAAASGDSAGSIAARSAALKANGQALDQNTKLEAATTSYYNTLDKNLTKLQELQGKVDTSGVPLVNKVYRAWQSKIAGTPDVAAYVTYLNSAAAEFAKIQSGSLGNAPVSDAARKHADEIINQYMTTGQINAVVDAMRGEGNNRLSSIREEGQAIRGAMGTNAPGQTPPGPQGNVGGSKITLQPGQSHSIGGFTVTRVN